ncbi:DUF5658 family protein [Limnoglobus roseus]|uniref:DUF5658 domain-containing protein n=1 Tax=Limnoglobus roseus TaxID=2598579 RepID=A0A5C1ASB2_9BACT|nr:DUF5658 family protein [Limnoglobus roseus]QEL20983.1 hypothetical protein PX52LOC_08111 [Limnoglobus roseus]
MTARRFCLYGMLVFGLLSVVDFVTTFALVLTKPGAYESNPVAGAWLEKYGWRGLAGFKSLSVLVVLGALGIVCWRRPRLGAWAVVAACFAMLTVAIYSRHLMLQPTPEPDPVEEVWDDDEE